MMLDLSGMHRELKRMEASNPESILFRLRETWGTAADAALYKEMEMEKKRWMMSALHSLDSLPDMEAAIPQKDRKVLALFESHGMYPPLDTPMPTYPPQSTQI